MTENGVREPAPSTGGTVVKRTPRPSVWRPRFLAELSETANVRAACDAAGVPRRTAYNHRDFDADFRAAWDTAIENACDTLEAVAWQRALTGQSDLLMIFLLKAHRPALYREHYQVEHTGAVGVVTLAELMAAMRDSDDSDAPPGG